MGRVRDGELLPNHGHDLRNPFTWNNDLSILFRFCVRFNNIDSSAPYRVGNFWQKNYSAKDGIDRTNAYSRRNSGWIPFRTLPRKRKQLGITFRGTKIEAYSRNSIPNPFAEEKTTRNSVPWNKNRSKLLEFCSKPFRGRENTRNSFPCRKNSAGYQRTGLGELRRLN